MIAPKHARFYAADWQFTDSRDNIFDSLSATTTNIDAHILAGRDLETVSVAKRLSWGSRRRTSRAEDIAYCLLGGDIVFSDSLPLLIPRPKEPAVVIQVTVLLGAATASRLHGVSLQP